eukprot:TRINITY_DN3792_c0_g1_i2.p1 TRINITY_DN3792_c0_g1~~TRINITY_DN3792_c0_g1_i2.p1  ORF type:complete len:168 (-),score=10.33 TRINITY_DN3792_c0_g1_i2:340-843(-)
MALANDGTKTDFDIQKNNFIASNNRDMFYGFSEELELKGYNEYTLIKVAEYDPLCFSSFWFTFYTFLTLAEVYKLYLSRHAKRHHRLYHYRESFLFTLSVIVRDFKIVKLVSSREDLNSEHSIQSYTGLTPCIVHRGSVRQYSKMPKGSSVLPNIPAEGELAAQVSA